MSELPSLQAVMDFLAAVPPLVAYASIAICFGLENFFPPVPSDIILLFAAFLVEQGGSSMGIFPLFFTAWIANLLGAVWAFRLARTRGRSVFETRWGRWALRPHQYRRMVQFYERHGSWAIFFSRFIPVVRIMVPVFGGFLERRATLVLIPIAVGALVWTAAVTVAGIMASRNLEWILDLLSRVNLSLGLVGVVVVGLVIVWWVRSRTDGKRDDDDEDEHSYAEHGASI